MNNVRSTSLEAFRRVGPKINKSQAEVLKVIRDHPEGLTDAEINHYLGYNAINRVTPRRNELVKKGLIYDAGRRECRKTHSQAHAYKAKVPVLPSAFPEEEKRRNEQEQLKNPNQLL